VLSEAIPCGDPISDGDLRWCPAQRVQHMTRGHNRAISHRLKRMTSPSTSSVAVRNITTRDLPCRTAEMCLVSSPRGTTASSLRVPIGDAGRIRQPGVRGGRLLARA
jgi:hypothetical protein